LGQTFQDLGTALQNSSKLIGDMMSDGQMSAGEQQLLSDMLRFDQSALNFASNILNEVMGHNSSSGADNSETPPTHQSHCDRSAHGGHTHGGNGDNQPSGSNGDGGTGSHAPAGSDGDGGTGGSAPSGSDGDGGTGSSAPAGSDGDGGTDNNPSAG